MFRQSPIVSLLFVVLLSLSIGNIRVRKELLINNLKASAAYAISYSLATALTHLQRELARVEKELVEIGSHVGAGISRARIRPQTTKDSQPRTGNRIVLAKEVDEFLVFESRELA